MTTMDENFIESLWYKLRNTQDDRLRALRDGDKHKSALLAGEVNTECYGLLKWLRII